MLSVLTLISCKKEQDVLTPSKKYEVIYKNASTFKSINSSDKDSIEVFPNQIVVINLANVDIETFFWFENTGNSSVSATLNTNHLDFTNSATIQNNDTLALKSQQLSYQANSNTLSIKNDGNSSAKIKYSLVKNKYDFVGFAHNELLEYLAYNPKFQISNTNEKVAIAKEYVTKIFGPFSVPSNINFDLINSELILYGENYVNILKNRNEITVNERNAFNKLFKISEKSQNRAQVESNLLVFDSEVTNDIKLTESEKIKILSTSATFKYSYAYWTKVQQDSNHPFYAYSIDINDNNGGRKMKVWAKDAIGAGIGVGVGLLLGGGWAFPLGCLIGGIASALPI